jgi:hypothetical protein
MPRCWFVDTLVLSCLNRSKRPFGCKLSEIFANSFAFSDMCSPHVALDDACMTLMILWRMVADDSSPMPRLLDHVKFTGKTLAKIACLSTSLDEYLTAFYPKCKVALEDRFTYLISSMPRW